jgi:hypothetical protein
LSFRALVIPEDFRKDEPLLQPIVERMLEACGRPARVRILKDPLLGGVSEALNWERIEEILDRYRNMVDCFLLIVDRDGVKTRRERLDKLEAKARELLGAPDRLLAENAWQEVEVWALAGARDLPKKWAWKTIRAAVHAKEEFFEPYIKFRGLETEPFGGRQRLGEEAARNYARIRKLCPEDVGALERRLKAR